METENGTTVRIRFRCRLPDGTVHRFGDRETLEVTIGTGTLSPALKKGMLGMNPGERRSIPVPAAEVALFPFPPDSLFMAGKKTPPGIAYEFGPGDGGDVSESIPFGDSKHLHDPLPAGVDLIFDVEMVG